ncbi:MAG: aminotransferase class V-fold PLP-dependent enzyme [Ignavibacteriaceae bacterium]|nr:aminotransferase class V-fold PLP-dependent enzyme [Ignavibacteriaceae bacterium]
MNISDIRTYFPYLNNRIIYFNHAATGPVCKPVIDRINEVLKERSESKMDDYQSFLSVADETKELLARYLNTGKERIAFTDNTSNGFNILAQGLKWESGDKIILNDIEFPSNVYPFLNLQKKGVQVEFVKSKDGIVSAEDIINAADNKTKLISVSYVQFLSGYKIDLEILGEFCKSKNIILSIDAIQGLGALQLDVQKCNIDFLSCGVQKWMLGLQGMAFIYISKELQEKMEPTFVGWLSVENAWDLLQFEMKIKSSASAFQTGTINAVGIYALNISLKMFESFGFRRVENSVIDHTLFLRNKLKDERIRLYPDELEEKYFSGIVTFKHPDSEGLFNWLTERNIITSLREKMIRLSPHFYNNEEDIDKVVDAIKNY